MPFILAVAGAACSPGKADAAVMLQDLTMSGTCSELVLAGAVQAQGCMGRVGYTLLDDGRTTFRFEALSADGLSLAFHGSGLSEMRAGQGLTALPVDGLTATRGGHVQALAATGKCIYGDPFRGRAILRCTATADANAYRGTFVSDAQPPQRHAATGQMPQKASRKAQ